MKRFFIISIFILLATVFVILVNYINITKFETLSVFANAANSVDFFIKNIENIVLSVYDIDITGNRLSFNQKEFITKMYILRNRAMFQAAIKGEENPAIDLSTFNLAYTYLFGESYVSNDNLSQVSLGALNVERFIPSSREVISFETEENLYKVLIIYKTKFADKEFKYRVTYNIGAKGGMYFLVGFTIDKIGDE